jgi:4-hydroxy-tetrahydrodipicolinate synthase
VKPLDPRLCGNVPALVTPCDARGESDLAAMARLVDHVIAAGVSGLNILGSTGEFSLVAPRQRAGIIRAAVDAARGRAPVICGCGRPSVEETVADVRSAAENGADAALVTPSYYFPLSDSEIARFVSSVAAQSPIPLLYYHYPDMTGCSVKVATIAGLARDGAISGIKDSSADATFFARLTSETADLRDFRIFIGGSAFLLGALAHGAHGVIGALSNFAASLDTAVIEAVRRADLTEARRAQARIVRVVDALFRSTPRNAATITKAILARFGVCGEDVFPPLDRLTEGERRQVLDQLPSLGIVGA